MPKVSVIIPVYNVESYLKECLDSVVNQDYKDYEVIIVDDGSIDNSLNIAKEYVSQLGSKLTIISKNNEGLSSARNLGISKASGEYIYFLDSDDYISPNTISLCVDIFIRNNVDIVFFNANAFIDNVNSSDFKDYNYDRNIKESVYDCNDLLTLFLSDKYIVSACCYMIKLSKFSHLKFPYGLLHEDNYYTTKLLCVENAKAYVSSEHLYQRRIRANSITTSNKTKKNIDGYMKVADLLLSENGNNKNVRIFCLRLYKLSIDLMREIDIKLSLVNKFKMATKSFKLGEPFKLSIKLFFPNLFLMLQSVKSKLKN